MLETLISESKALERGIAGEELSFQDGIDIMEYDNIHLLGAVADISRQKLVGDQVTFTSSSYLPEWTCTRSHSVASPSSAVAPTAHSCLLGAAPALLTFPAHLQVSPHAPHAPSYTLPTHSYGPYTLTSYGGSHNISATLETSI